MTEAGTIYNMDELLSQNAYGVVELVDGTKVKCQFTMRYGISAEKALAQLDEWRAFLEGATARGVKFDGPNVLIAPTNPYPVGDTQVHSTVNADTEPHYEEIDGAKVFTVAQVFHDKTKNGKDVLKVVTVEAPYATKFGVSCFHPGPEFDGWKNWPIGGKDPVKYAPPAGATHVVIRPAPEGGYPDVIEFRP